MRLQPQRFIITALLGLGILGAQTERKARLVVAGSVRPETTTSVDRGPVSGTMRLTNLVLALRPPADAQAKVESAIRSLHDPSSAQFHHWLSPGDFATQLGITDDAIFTAQRWLESKGLQPDRIDPARTAVYFSGTAAQVESAFHTRLHRFQSPDGAPHIANTTEPLVPEDLAKVAVGIVALHDFGPRRDSPPLRTVPNIVFSGGGQDLGAGDLQVIYGIDQVHAAGFSGQEQTIAVLETSDIYSAGDWLAYRRVFGLTKKFPQGRLITVHPSGPATCLAPVSESANREATLDSEVATAAAPNATVIIASCANTVGDSGLNIALRNLLNSAILRRLSASVTATLKPS